MNLISIAFLMGFESRPSGIRSDLSAHWTNTPMTRPKYLLLVNELLWILGSIFLTWFELGRRKSDWFRCSTQMSPNLKTYLQYQIRLDFLDSDRDVWVDQRVVGTAPRDRFQRRKQWFHQPGIRKLIWPDARHGLVSRIWKLGITFRQYIVLARYLTFWVVYM